MPPSSRPIVIAHRGASGYLPEHTLAGKTLAHAMRADFLEQDLVLTRDDHPVVLHDIFLDTVTDVATRFPERARNDGRFYAIDFTLEEIQSLRVHERVHRMTGKPVFPGRFPVGGSRFHVPSLSEEIELIHGLNRTTGRRAGLYAEIKAPAWHRAQGKDISRIVLDTFQRFGYTRPADGLILQCFDPTETRRLRNELGSQLRLIQLIGDNAWHEAESDYDELRKPAGLDKIAEYANGIGPWLPQILGEGRVGSPTSLVADAHRVGLLVHAYTARADELPEGVATFEELIDRLIAAGVDGIFTDFPDQVVTRVGPG